MSELPPIKPPKDFAGVGLERIGDPAREDLGILRFRDGKFVGMVLPDPSDVEWTPETAAQHAKEWLRDQVEDLAEKIRQIDQLLENPDELAKIPDTIDAMRRKIIEAGNEAASGEGLEEPRARWNSEALKVERRNLEQELRSLKPPRSRKDDTGRLRFVERAAKNIREGGERYDSPLSARARVRLAVILAIHETSKELGRPPMEWEVVNRMQSLTDGNGRMTATSSNRDLQRAIRKDFPWLDGRRGRGYQGER